MLYDERCFRNPIVPLMDVISLTVPALMSVIQMFLSISQHIRPRNRQSKKKGRKINRTNEWISRLTIGIQWRRPGGVGPPYFGQKRKKITERRKAGGASKKTPPPPLPQGLDPPLEFPSFPVPAIMTTYPPCTLNISRKMSPCWRISRYKLVISRITGVLSFTDHGE